VQARLGHASAVETLNTYAHLWPDSDDRTREAIESVLGNNSRPTRGLEAFKARQHPGRGRVAEVPI